MLEQEDGCDTLCHKFALALELDIRLVNCDDVMSPAMIFSRCFGLLPFALGQYPLECGDASLLQKHEDSWHVCLEVGSGYSKYQQIWQQ